MNWKIVFERSFYRQADESHGWIFDGTQNAHGHHHFKKINNYDYKLAAILRNWFCCGCCWC